MLDPLSPQELPPPPSPPLLLPHELLVLLSPQEVPLLSPKFVLLSCWVQLGALLAPMSEEDVVVEFEVRPPAWAEESWRPLTLSYSQLPATAPPPPPRTPVKKLEPPPPPPPPP